MHQVYLWRHNNKVEGIKLLHMYDSYGHAM